MYRNARPEEFPLLQELEMEAGQRFAEFGMPEVSDSPPMLIKLLQECTEHGGVWVADIEDTIAGFIAFTKYTSYIHIDEISVHTQFGRRGIATEFLERLAQWGTNQGMQGITLSTFKDVPWNRPFYEKRGFVVLTPEQYPPYLDKKAEEEASRGLYESQRVCMARFLPSPSQQ